MSLPPGWKPIPEFIGCGDEITPAIVKDGAIFIQQGWFIGDDMPQTARLLREFKAAHAIAAAKAGLSAEQVALENTLFSHGSAGIWPTVKETGGDTIPSAQGIFICNGVRLVATSLTPDIVRSVAAVGTALRGIPNGYPSPELTAKVEAAFKTGVVSPLPVSEDIALLLCVFLNMPARADAFVYSVSADAPAECICWQATLDLDCAAVEDSLKRIIPRAQPHQKPASRIVCVTCGAAPCASGIVLKECAGCQRLAYCSDRCCLMDWHAAHQYECCQTKQRQLPDGRTCLSHDDVRVTRAQTEGTKGASMKSPYPSDKSGFSVAVEAATKQLPSGQVGMMPIPMGWHVTSLNHPPSRRVVVDASPVRKGTQTASQARKEKKRKAAAAAKQ